MRKLIGVVVASALAVATLGGVATAKAGNATLNVVHGIPGLTVDVCVDGATAIPDFAPGTVITGVELPAGSHEFKIVAQNGDCAGAGILVVVAGLKADTNYTAVANLDASGDPNLKLFTNNVKAVAKGTSRLTVRHTAAAPAVNVWANGAVLIGGNGLHWGESSDAGRPEGDLHRLGVASRRVYAPVIGPAVAPAEGRLRVSGLRLGRRHHGYDFAVVAIKVGTN